MEKSLSQESNDPSSNYKLQFITPKTVLIESTNLDLNYKDSTDNTFSWFNSATDENLEPAISQNLIADSIYVDQNASHINPITIPEESLIINDLNRFPGAQKEIIKRQFYEFIDFLVDNQEDVNEGYLNVPHNEGDHSISRNESSLDMEIDTMQAELNK